MVNISGICHRRAGTAVSGAGLYLTALIVILLNRLLDGLDGAWRGAEDLPTRAAFSIFLSISLLRAGAVWFYSRRTRTKRAAGGWLLFAFIGTGSSFLAFAR